MKYFWTMVSALLLAPTYVYAEGTLGDAPINVGRTGQQAGTSELSDLGTIVGMAINVLLSLIGLIFLVLMVYAGFLWMTARGEEDQVNTARKIIIQALIGLFIVVSAYAITYLVTSVFE